MNKIVFLVLLIILNSCVNKDESLQHVVDCYQKKNISFNEELEVCLVLPEVGCGGCIASGVFFFKENKEAFLNGQKKYLIIFTAIKSKKMLFRSLGVSSLEPYNCILDENNDYLVEGNNSIYPLVLYLKKGSIYKVEYQSPDSGDVFGKLKIKLENSEI